MTNNLLSIALSAAVPLKIMEIQARGGITGDDLKQLPQIAQLLAEHGDDLLFKSVKKGETAKVFNEVVCGIAILAFVPGGITIFGQHFEASSNKQ